MLLKDNPEDFIVEELAEHKTYDEGMYTLIKVTKTNRSTLDVIKQLALALHIKEKHIGFAGMKDRNAVTTQYFSVQQVKLEAFNKILLRDCIIEPLGYIKDRINLGDLDGNKFTIVIKNYKESLYQKKYMPNYFGEQRFSTNNVVIGLHILRNEFKEAAEYLKEHHIVEEYLQSNPTDYIGAIRLLPKRLLKIFIAAVQSQLFNEMLTNQITKQTHVQDELLAFPTGIPPEGALPLVGFATKTNENVDEVLANYALTPRSFVTRSIPELSADGALRNTRVELKNLEVKQIDDTTWKVKFTLPPSAYATIAVKALCVENQ